ncbi:tRNA (adenine(22)-N(1))-methyltransferase [Paenibacillus chungangensis]|uniref:tRNA (Adenine(22)-N(1))-methyltransferase n=1 Tax=Paenibacillus chungangensis TaxID=696535 RepID=A0ABW3HML8_9BACL
MIKLSNRLQKIASYITPGSRVADIGSDHALLPVYLLQSGIAVSAIAGELNAGPLAAAKKQAADAGLAGRLQVRQGNGLAVLQGDEADTVTIAGMGGGLMKEILEEGHERGKLAQVQELVLQPNVGEDIVRSWLLEKGWYLKAECILEEDGKIYEVLHAQRTSNAEQLNGALYDGSFLGLAWQKETTRALLVHMGPHLLRSGGPILIMKWQSELQKLNRICGQLAESELPQAAMKRTQIQEEIIKIGEVLQCLQTAND